MTDNFYPGTAIDRLHPLQITPAPSIHELNYRVRQRGQPQIYLLEPVIFKVFFCKFIVGMSAVLELFNLNTQAATHALVAAGHGMVVRSAYTAQQT